MNKPISICTSKILFSKQSSLYWFQVACSAFWHSLGGRHTASTGITWTADSLITNCMCEHPLSVSLLSHSLTHTRWPHFSEPAEPPSNQWAGHIHSSAWWISTESIIHSLNHSAKYYNKMAAMKIKSQLADHRFEETWRNRNCETILLNL